MGRPPSLLLARISGEQAMLFIGSIRERLSVIALDGDEIYDAMPAHCALKAAVKTIYSWNGRHYAQCGPEVVRRLQTP